MRFDDRLQTSLRHTADDPASVAVRWRQLIDILAQNPKHFPPVLIKNGLIQIREMIAVTPVEDRVASVKSLSGRLKSAPLVQLLAADAVPVASATIAGAKLTDGEWAAIIPTLPIRARGFLRNRSDIGPQTRKSLMIWSSADYVLAAPLSAPLSAPLAEMAEEIAAVDVAQPDDAVPNGQPLPTSTPATPDSRQIGAIVERIEKLRKDREIIPPAQLTDQQKRDLQFSAGIYADSPAPDGPALSAAPIVEIQFETDEYGTICWAEGAPRGALVGIGISEPAFGDSPGPDAYGAAAFRQRMPLENARMQLCGAPTVAGDWRLSANPFFDSRSGRFQGYRGLLRRPTLAETAHIAQPDLGLVPQATPTGDQLQQLVHELRTPMGAIIGFSEIIEQQMFGPVASEYRIRAREILHDAERLLAGFDDLSIAAKIESGRFVAAPGVTECHWLTARLAQRLHGLSETLAVTLNLVAADPVRPFAVECEMSERLFSRLLSAIIIGCERGELLSGRFHTEPGFRAVNKFTLTLPKKLAGLREDQLLGSISGDGVDGTDDDDSNNNAAPVLGLGFSLRLVRNLARNVNGDLRFYKECLVLSLPAVKDTGVQYRGGQ